MALLSDAEVRQYQELGYLVPSFRLSAPLVDSLRDALDRLLRDNPGVRPEKLISAHLSGRGGSANAEGVRGQADFLALARNEQILDAVEQLIGPDIILWGCHVFCKPAGDGHETPWHQDGHYWPIRPLATCTVWVALDESVTENGCLRVIPRSHLARTSHPHLHEDPQDLALQQRLPDSAFDAGTAVDMNCSRGRCRCTTCT
jgi:ectoine hydroxylase-related dioxygenase (phytanoyl-CoA dioxygenase family)